MKICVVGAGAIGGLIAGNLAREGHEVCVIARGEHLRAIAGKGLTLRKRGDSFTVRCAAADDPARFGPQDAIFIALKAPAVGAMLPRLEPLLGEHTMVLPALNGIPWWYFHKEGGKLDGSPVRCLDPDGAMLKALDLDRIVGCVVYAGANIPEPGVIELTSQDERFDIGEPDGSVSNRAKQIADAMTAARMATAVATRIRDAIWAKLQGNLSFNPLAALAMSHMGEIFSQPRLLELAADLMREGEAVGTAYGAKFSMDVPKRVEIARRLGNARPSMLQDVELRRPMEVEAIVGVVAELGRLAGVPTPATDVIYALIGARDATLRKG